MKGMSAVSTLSSSGAVVAHVEVCRDVALDLGVAAAERGEHRQGEQFAGLQRLQECPNSDYLQVWIDVLLEGTPRRRARPRRTTFARLASIRPFLAETAFH